MSSENKILLQDNFAVTAHAVALDAVVKKAKAWGVLVEIAACEQLRQMMQPPGRTIYAVVDQSDSMGPAAGAMAHALLEIIRCVDLFKSRLLVYPLGQSAPVVLAEVSEADARTRLQHFLKENGSERGRRSGTFIEPTLRTIEQDSQGRRDEEQPVLMIFSDAEIWDWELYRDFFKRNQSFRVGFLETGGQRVQNKIVEEVRLVNKQHEVAGRRTAAELLDQVLSSPDELPSVIDAISLQLSFEPSELLGVMDLHGKQIFEPEGNRFDWKAPDGALPATLFQRLYLLGAARPQRFRLHGRLAKASETQAVDENFAISAQAKTLAEVLRREDERRRFAQLVEQKCVTAWSWNQPLLEILINALRAGENLPRAPFNLHCPNPDKKLCGLLNKAENWIFQPEHSPRCWNCRQILLHLATLETTDPKLRGANLLLLEIVFSSPTGTIEISDEPHSFNYKEEQAKEIGNFKIHGRDQATVLRDRTQHYKLAAIDGAFKYESRIVQANEELSLSSFDVMKPLFEDSAAPETYYLVMDISKII